MSAHKAINKIYKKNGSILKIVLETPFLFVCTTKDVLVPPESTISLYYKFKEIGHKSVYIFITESAHHGAIALFDRNNYAKALHGFYKENGIPFNEKLAEEGLKLLKKSEAKAEEIMKELRSYPKVHMGSKYRLVLHHFLK